MDQKPQFPEDAEKHINEIQRQRGFPEDPNNNATNINQEDLLSAINMYATS
jgi:hypothetical protein